MLVRTVLRSGFFPAMSPHIEEHDAGQSATTGRPHLFRGSHFAPVDWSQIGFKIFMLVLGLMCFGSGGIPPGWRAPGRSSAFWAPTSRVLVYWAFRANYRAAKVGEMVITVTPSELTVRNR